MFYINETDIYLTRGDTANFHLDILDGEDEYTLKETDILTLSVKKNAKQEKVYLKVYGDNSGNFTILPSQTKNMYFGEYEYDIQLYINEREVYTVVPVSKFTVLKEIS